MQIEQYFIVGALFILFLHLCTCGAQSSTHFLFLVWRSDLKRLDSNALADFGSFGDLTTWSRRGRIARWQVWYGWCVEEASTPLPHFNALIPHSSFTDYPGLQLDSEAVFRFFCTLSTVDVYVSTQSKCDHRKHFHDRWSHLQPFGSILLCLLPFLEHVRPTSSRSFSF